MNFENRVLEFFLVLPILLSRHARSATNSSETNKASSISKQILMDVRSLDPLRDLGKLPICIDCACNI